MVDKQFVSVNNVPPEPWTGQDTRDRGMRCLIAPHFLALPLALCFQSHNPYNARMSTALPKHSGVRIKDKHAPLLRRMASEVNLVWNYCNQANRNHWRKHRQHLTGFDLNKLCAGSSTAFQLIGACNPHDPGNSVTESTSRTRST